MTSVESKQQFAIRLAEPADDRAIAALVVGGSQDFYRRIFECRFDQSVEIMEKMLRLERIEGARTLVAVVGPEVAGCVGMQFAGHEPPVDEKVARAAARDFWSTLRGHLGLPRAIRALILLSLPRYDRYDASSSEAYLARFVVAPEYRRLGVARPLFDAAESLCHEADQKTVCGFVRGDDPRLLRMYKFWGYSEVRRQRSLLSGCALGIRDYVYLRKDLTPSWGDIE